MRLTPTKINKQLTVLNLQTISTEYPNLPDNSSSVISTTTRFWSRVTVISNKFDTELQRQQIFCDLKFPLQRLEFELKLWMRWPGFDPELGSQRQKFDPELQQKITDCGLCKHNFKKRKLFSNSTLHILVPYQKLKMGEVPL